MKKLIALLAVVGLSGCVGYVPYGSPYGNSSYYSGSPSYYGSPYGASVPYVVDQPSVYIYGNSGYGHPRRFSRDRDRDGIPDRFDRDRDGDGVPNRRDAFPGDPRRR